jgi:hypothetical protein
MLAGLPAAVMLGAVLKGRRKVVKPDDGKPEPAARDESSRGER